jgi:phage terminase large subunit GpA-like protein
MKQKKSRPSKSHKINFGGVVYSCKELDALSINQPMNPVEFVKKIRLGTKANIESQIDLTLTPYIKKPIETLQDYRVEMIVVIAPTQSAKTVVAQVCVAWSIDQDPGPMLYVLPDEDTAKRAIDEKLIGMIDATPCLKNRVKSVKKISKEGLKLDSMEIYPAWSNSLASLSAFPKKRVVWDEGRLFKLSVGKESNAIKLGEDRMTTYKNLGIGQGLMVSSPSVEGDLLHQQIAVPGTVELFWYVPCPACGRYQKLDFFTNLKKIENSDTVVCKCRFTGCDGIFSDRDMKREWNNKGVYAPFDPSNPEAVIIDNDGTLEVPVPFSKRLVFRWDSMVSPFRSFKRIWDEYCATKDHLGDYKNFVQAWLAQFWKEGISKNNVESIKLRKSSYSIGNVPKGVKVLCGGIDTQDDSIFFTIYGFGNNKQVWLIDEGQILCDMHTTNAEDLKDIIITGIVNNVYIGEEDGRQWSFVICAWDSGGHRTKEVYEVTRKVRQIVAIKGRNQLNRSVVYSEKETHYNIRTEEYLNETESIAQTESFHVPHNVSPQFLQQFGAQAKLKKEHPRTGKVTFEWVSKGADHLRLASAYAFSCLDIPIANIGTLRRRLNDLNFELNPRRSQARYVRDTGDERQQQQKRTLDPFETHARAQRGRERQGDWWS